MERVKGEVGYRAALDRTAQRHVRYDRGRTGGGVAGNERSLGPARDDGGQVNPSIAFFP